MNNTFVSIPAKIGRYRITRRLGAGAFATVWLAEDDLLDSRVAIKVLADNWAHHHDVRARFEQEAQVLRLADSELLVRVHDVGELPDGRPYQVMTYADGGTLAERLTGGPMPIGTALRTAADIADAVTVLHEAGVLHRDLKPSNVLFTTVRGRRRVLVADLGLAKTIAHASGFTVVAGTPGYMSPEQAVPGGGIDVRTDVHALGALTYHMLTGRPPQPAEGAPPAAPSRLRPGVPRQVDQIVLRALERDRQRRWPSAQTYASALHAVTDPPVRRRTGILRALRRAVGSVAVVAALTVLGGSAYAAGWVRVSDATGTVSVAVPDGWAVQMRAGGWEPVAVGLPENHRPGLLIGAELDAWADPLSPAPGVFAGLSTTMAGGATPRLPAHNRCLRAPDRPVNVAGASGRVRRWTRCDGTAISYSEVTLEAGAGYGVYVQVKQSGPDDRTDEVLRTLRLRRH